MDKQSFDQHIERVKRTWGENQVFFVSGAPKSGTTWLQKALDAHSQIVCAGEGHFADHLARGLSRVFKDYFGQQRLVDKNVYEGRGHYKHSPNEDYDFIVMTSVLNAFARLDLPAGTRFIGDKTPANAGYLEVFRRLFPDAKFVSIVRDGRDALVSTFKHVERVARTDGTVDDMDDFLSNKTRMYCERWVKALDDTERFGRIHPGLLHTVRYEDLKQDFHGAFAGVLKFLGADASTDELARCEEESSFKRLSGGRDAGQEDPNAFVRKGVVGDWRGNLTAGQLAVFNEVGGAWLARLGYGSAS